MPELLGPHTKYNPGSQRTEIMLLTVGLKATRTHITVESSHGAEQQKFVAWSAQ